MFVLPAQCDWYWTPWELEGTGLPGSLTQDLTVGSAEARGLLPVGAYIWERVGTLESNGSLSALYTLKNLSRATVSL